MCSVSLRECIIADVDQPHLPTVSKAKALHNLQQSSVDGARHRRNPKRAAYGASNLHQWLFFLHLGFLAKTRLKYLSRVDQSISNNIYRIPYISILSLFYGSSNGSSSFQQKYPSKSLKKLRQDESLSLLCQRSQEGGDPNPDLNRRIGHLLEILTIRWDPLRIRFSLVVAHVSLHVLFNDLRHVYTLIIFLILHVLEVNWVVLKSPLDWNKKSGKWIYLNLHLQNDSKIPAVSSNSVSLVCTRSTRHTQTNWLFRDESDSNVVVHTINLDLYNMT